VTRSTPASAESDLAPNWLRQLGFKADPFTLRHAALEERLDEYFVAPPGFEVMRQPYTTLLFAPRGGGKTACRMMVERTCLPFDRQSRVLVIPYYRALEGLVKQMSAQDWPQTGRTRHIEALLKFGAYALLDGLTAQETAFFAADQLAFLRGLLEMSDRDFFAPPNLLWRLRQSGALVAPFDLDSVLASIPARQLSQTLGGALNPQSRRGQLLVSLADAPTLKIADEPLNVLAGVARAFGIEYLFVLVDGLDEFPSYASSDEQAELLYPLLSDLHLLTEHPSFRFKFFLPAELLPVLKCYPEIRLDRLSVHSVSWSEHTLRELLRLRLQAFSDSRVQSLSELFDDPGSVTDIDMRLVGWANSSPRALLELSDELLSVHSQRDDAAPKLTVQDWEIFAARFQTQYAPQLVPPLRVDEKSKQVFVGTQLLNVSFTPNEFDLLCLLYRRAGQVVSKDEVWREVLGYNVDGVSDTAIDSLVFRTRKKIEKDPKNPVYLHTVRGAGYVLRNVEGADDRR